MAYDSRSDTLLHVAAVRQNLGKIIVDLERRSDEHDTSKMESPEKEIFDEMTPKLRATTYGSDEYKGYLTEMKVGLDHHYAANDHHPEHFRWRCGVCEARWTDKEWEIAPQGPNDSGKRYCPDCCPRSINYECELVAETDKGLHGMNLVQLIEMLCDWEAATQRHADGDILKSIDINQKRFGYSDELRQILLNTLPCL